MCVSTSIHLQCYQESKQRNYGTNEKKKKKLLRWGRELYYVFVLEEQILYIFLDGCICYCFLNAHHVVN